MIWGIRGLLGAESHSDPDTWVYRASLHLGIELLVVAGGIVGTFAGGPEGDKRVGRGPEAEGFFAQAQTLSDGTEAPKLKDVRPQQRGGPQSNKLCSVQLSP